MRCTSNAFVEKVKTGKRFGNDIMQNYNCLIYYVNNLTGL